MAAQAGWRLIIGIKYNELPLIIENASGTLWMDFLSGSFENRKRYLFRRRDNQALYFCLQERSFEEDNCFTKIA